MSEDLDTLRKKVMAVDNEQGEMREDEALAMQMEKRLAASKENIRRLRDSLAVEERIAAAASAALERLNKMQRAAQVEGEELTERYQ